MAEKVINKNNIFCFFLLPLISIVVATVFLELIVAFFFPVPVPLEKNFIYENDPFTGYRVKPNSTGYYRGGIPAEANNHGFRDDPVSFKKSSNTAYRIFLIGDSFTVGANLPNKKTYPYLLEQFLKKHAPPGKKIEVINSAVGGWSPFQYAQYYLNYGKYFDADLVLVGFYIGNDTLDTDNDVKALFKVIGGRRVVNITWLSKTKMYLTTYSHLFRKLLYKSPKEFVFIRSECNNFSPLLLHLVRPYLNVHLDRKAPGFSFPENSIYQMQRIFEQTETEGVPLAIALIPAELQVNTVLQEKIVGDPQERQKYNFDMPQLILVETFAEMGIETIDLLEPFRQSTECLYMQDTHFSPEGSALAAKILAEEIAKRFLKF